MLSENISFHKQAPAVSCTCVCVCKYFVYARSTTKTPSTQTQHRDKASICVSMSTESRSTRKQSNRGRFNRNVFAIFYRPPPEISAHPRTPRHLIRVFAFSLSSCVRRTAAFPRQAPSAVCKQSINVIDDVRPDCQIRASASVRLHLPCAICCVICGAYRSETLVTGTGAPANMTARQMPAFRFAGPAHAIFPRTDSLAPIEIVEHFRACMIDSALGCERARACHSPIANMLMRFRGGVHIRQSWCFVAGGFQDLKKMHIVVCTNVHDLCRGNIIVVGTAGHSSHNF